MPKSRRFQKGSARGSPRNLSRRPATPCGRPSSSAGWDPNRPVKLGAAVVASVRIWVICASILRWPSVGIQPKVTHRAKPKPRTLSLRKWRLPGGVGASFPQFSQKPSQNRARSWASKRRSPRMPYKKKLATFCPSLPIPAWSLPHSQNLSRCPATRNRGLFASL